MRICLLGAETLDLVARAVPKIDRTPDEGKAD
jgi:hypothetical protein